MGIRSRHIRRGAPPRRGRSTRTRGHAKVHHRPASRGSRYSHRGRTPGRYSHRGRTPRLNLGKPLIAAGVAIVLAVAGYAVAHRLVGVAGAATRPADVGAPQFISTARTANGAAITLPDAVQDNLRQAGLAHQTIELTRVGYTGNVSTSYIDMTPRTGSSSQDPVLKVSGREVPVIDAKISGIETAINSPAATTGGGQALYAGLTRIDFTGAPVTIISSGIDLADPDDFRVLKWTVPPEEVVADVKKAGALPSLHGPVTFVLVPTSGPQPQLEEAQKTYLKAVWTALLTAAGATSVTFIDALGTAASSAAPSTPIVSIPALPATPIPLVSVGNNKVTCTVPDSYFIFKTPTLFNPAKTRRDLTPCINAALAVHATFALDGWTSYEGPLSADSKPEFDYPYNRQLSEARVRTIANLLVDDLGVPSSAITRMTGHGNVDQPDPDPRSPANRVVVITYTTN